MHTTMIHNAALALLNEENENGRELGLVFFYNDPALRHGLKLFKLSRRTVLLLTKTH